MSSHPYPHLFSPITIGTMNLRNRTTAPPHASAIGNIFGSDADAERNIAYFEERATAGLAWIGALSTHLQNTFIPGFEPTGVGAATLGFFRLPFFVERIQQFADTMHRHDTYVTVQMVHQGGMPHGPSPVKSAPVINLMPHVMNHEDIAAFTREYAASARLAQEGRADGVELHYNHDDLHEWFLSPLTNQRTDKYGGSLENRCRFAVETLQAIRDEVGSTMTVGVRLNLRQEAPGGFDNSGSIEIAQYLESTGLIDYVHGVVGSPWGNPSYIQPTWFDPAQWADLAGNLKRAISLPVVYTGKVNGPDVAEKVLADGNADVVGIARAFIADGQLLAKAEAGRAIDIRPCIGCNECISRRYVEGLPFGCAVNPSTSNEVDGPWPVTDTPRRGVVVGGGPAGMELAALCRESGHDVSLWEASDRLGGQLRWAGMAPDMERYDEYLDWQERRLATTGVNVELGKRARAADVLAAEADVVAVATGAIPYRPAIPGVDGEQVVDARDVLDGTASTGQRVLVVAQDDHLPPLLVADHLARQGKDVTVVYATNAPAQLLGRYIVGAILGRLDENGVEIRLMEDVVGIEPSSVTVRNVYSGVERTLPGIESVVLACSGVSDTGLYEELKGQHPQVHILGDAYAPRRLVYATRQAYALARLLTTNN